VISKEILDAVLAQIDIREDGTLIKRKTGEVQKQWTNQRGYKCINIRIGGKQKKFLVHRLVASVHSPNPENKPCVDHVDNNPANNAAENLRWVTHAENMRYAAESGLCGLGKLGGPMKHDSGRDRWVRTHISPSRCDDMRRWHKNGVGSIAMIAREFGVSLSLATAIIRDGYIPKQIPDEPEGHKFCSSCETIKPYAAFSKDKRGVHELFNYCKQCQADRHKSKKLRAVIADLIYETNPLLTLIEKESK